MNLPLPVEDKTFNLTNPTSRLPFWFRQEIPEYKTLKKMDWVCELEVNTVCKEAKCPNMGSCFSNGKITFMILGNSCTRNCRFCGINKSKNETLTVDEDEPARIIQIIKEFGLKYAVITSVTRDDLPDGGAGQFVRTIKAIHGLNRNIIIEILIPDFKGNISSLKSILDDSPDVVAHNIETVPRLYKDLRPQADYLLSLEVLSNIKILKPSIISKSSIMLGLGEGQDEVIAAMEDLRKSRCDILTLGQYLAPSEKQVAVKEFIQPQHFARYRDIGLSLGFKAVLSGPLVRSSYKAEEVFAEVMG
jgi:lipoic acid synthetase